MLYDLLQVALFSALLVLLYVLCSLAKHIFFPNIVIVGDSMLPTLSEGEMYSSKRIHFKTHYKYKIGKIYVFRSKHEDGESVIAIKRLVKIDPNNNYLWFEGDNSVVSYDSRMYGFVSPQSVIAELRKRVR